MDVYQTWGPQTAYPIPQETPLLGVTHMGVSIMEGAPKGWFTMEYPSKMHDLGVPPFTIQ